MRKHPCCQPSYTKKRKVLAEEEEEYTETLSDEAVKQYQSADFCFPLCRN